MHRFGVRLFAFVFLLLPIVLSLHPIASSAQTGAPPSAALPTDPLQFLDLASKVNGLGSEAAGPWHVKATFQIYDDQGKAQETGTYEAFWKSPNRYKMIYTSPSYNRTIWANDSGTFATSNPRWPADVEWMIRRSLFDLVPEPGIFKDWKLYWSEASIGINVNCIEAATSHFRIRRTEVPVFCFEFGTPVIRFDTGVFQRRQGSFNHIVTIGNAYVARDVQLARLGKPRFKLHIDSLAPLSDSADDPFQPDSRSVPVPSGLLINPDLRDVHATNRVDIFSSQAGVGRQAPFADSWIPSREDNQWTIVRVLVNQKGKVVDASPIQGDLHTEFLAVEAAMQWEFEPYLVQGEPTEFYTELEFR